jgi:DNA-binding NarL/FixJ family response regulator
MTDLDILLSDDHTVVRQGLRRILEECPGWRVVGEAADGRSAVRMASEVRPNVAVLDISMPLLNGIDATRQIRRRHPDIGVVILSMHTEETFITTAVQAGARGYVLKDAADTELIRGVAAVASGESFLSPAAAQTARTDYLRYLNRSTGRDRYDALSEREREIFQLIAESYSNTDIANLLSIAVATVETHRAHILRKLDLHSTAQLVHYAVGRGVVS